MASKLQNFLHREGEEGIPMATDVPEDILINMLARLPVTSLLRCRCVCKSWCSLISSPLFISAHHSNAAAGKSRTVIVRRREPFTRKLRYTLHSDDESLAEIAEFDFPSSNPDGFLRILGSVNGLICLVNPNYALMLWNPSIRKTLILPEPSLRLTSSNCPVLGFGFDPLANDYKVVKVVYGSSMPYVEIYRLSTRSWSRIDLSGDVSTLPLLYPRQAYLNGIIHWLGYDYTIVGFDLRTEAFKVMNLPGDLKGKKMDNVVIAAWCGLLALLELEDSKNICLWLMKEYDMLESWTRQCLISTFPATARRVKSIRTNGEILVEDTWGSLFWFDPATRGTRDLTIQGLGDLSVFLMKFYTESLVLVDVKDESIVLGKPDDQGVTDNGLIKLCHRWSGEEEKLLIRAWLNTSKDALKGTNQRVDSFWGQIEAYFKKHHRGGTQRGLNQLKRHWYMINKTVSKFHDCYNKICQLHKGRMAENDMVLQAYQAYRNEEKRCFRHKHVWLLLKDEPKWKACEGGEEGSSKRAKVSESGAYTSSSNADNSDADDTEVSKRKGKAKLTELEEQAMETDNVHETSGLMGQ